MKKKEREELKETIDKVAVGLYKMYFKICDNNKEKAIMEWEETQENYDRLVELMRKQK